MKDFAKWVKSLPKNDIDLNGLDAVIRNDKSMLIACSYSRKERKEIKRELRVLEKIRTSIVG